MDNNNEFPCSATMRFTLTSFIGAQVKDMENELGDVEKFVCIPLDRNGLKLTDNGNVSAYSYVNKNTNANIFGWTHAIRLKVSKDWYDKMKGLGYEPPYLGNLKPCTPRFKVGANAGHRVRKEDLL